MKKILCPVDGSLAANTAIEYAARLVKEFNGTLYLMHVPALVKLEDVANISGGIEPMVEDREAHALDLLSQQCQEVEKEFDIPCVALVKSSGNLVAAINGEVKKNNIDLIVMGTGWAENLYEFFFGSHTYRTARKSHIPLLIIPQDQSYSRPAKVVYATDYDKGDCDALRQVIKFTAGFEPEITVVHISRQKTEISQEVYQCIRNIIDDELNHPYLRFMRLIHESTSKGLDDYMHQSGSDLLVLLTNKKTLLEDVVKGSVTRQISNINSYPVLIIHGND